MRDQSIKKLFKGHAIPLALFEVAKTYIESLHSVTMSVTKTQVAFKTKRQFAWVWMPQIWIKEAPKDGIVVSFTLDHCIKDKRIKETLEPYPGRFMHHVVIENPSRFDAALKRWLREAHALSMQTSSSK